MPYTQHVIIIAIQPYLAHKPPSPYTSNQPICHQCHAPPHRVDTTCYRPSWKPTLPTMALLFHGLEASCGARCLHMLPPHTAHWSNSSKETRYVPFKEPLRALLIWHENLSICWKNINPNGWPNAAQASSFLVPLSATSKVSNIVHIK